MARLQGNPASKLLTTPLVQLILFAFLGVLNVAALDVAYCSGQNTGASYNSVTERYQSNGKCFDNCKANYAFAIVQGSVCWCSNYAPGSTTSIGSCSEGCPGIDTEHCGNTAQNLFGYIALSKSPSGTQGVSTSAQPSSTSASVAPTTVSSQFSRVLVTLLATVPSSPAPKTPAAPTSFTSFEPASVRLSRTVISLPTSSTLVSTTASTLTTSSIQTTATIVRPVTLLTTAATSSVEVVSTVTASPVISTSLTTPSSTTSSTTSSIPSSSTRSNPTSSSSPTSSASPTTSSATSAAAPSTSSAAPPPTSTPPPPQPAASVSTTTTTWSASAYVTIMTVTGKMTTVTITPSEPPPPTATVTAAENNNNNKGSGALSTSGKVAGLAVGVAIIVLGLIGGIAFFLWRRHKGKGAARNQALHGGDDATPRIRSRSMSESGLLGEGGRTLPRIQTGMSTRRLGSGNTNSPEETYSSHRLSSPRIVDQRLDPVSIWTQHDNSSRASVKSLQDNQDYSRRMLKVSNPDE